MGNWNLVIYLLNKVTEMFPRCNINCLVSKEGGSLSMVDLCWRVMDLKGRRLGCYRTWEYANLIRVLKKGAGKRRADVHAPLGKPSTPRLKVGYSCCSFPRNIPKIHTAVVNINITCWEYRYRESKHRLHLSVGQPGCFYHLNIAYQLRA